MPRLLADVNLDGHARWLKILLDEDPLLSSYRAALHVSVSTFDDIGLDRNMADDDLWKWCQEDGSLLITANRNADGPHSLEMAIRDDRNSTGLPVFTLADADRFLESRDYGFRVAYQLVEYLIRLPDLLGVGRLYLP